MARAPADNLGMPTGPNWPLPVPSYGPEPRRPRGSWLSKVIAVLIPALLALPYLPDSLRTLLPEGLRSHLPHVEFMRRGLAMRSAADSSKFNEAAMGGTFSLDAVALERPEETEPVPVSKVTHSHRTARKHAQWESDDGGERDGMQYVPDHAVSVVPSHIKTEIRLASTPAPDGTDDYARQDWPMLCAQVVDASGVPVAGAHVELESPRLMVITDAKGRFCVASPPGNCTLHIEAEGRGHAACIFALQQSLYDLRIELKPQP